MGAKSDSCGTIPAEVGSESSTPPNFAKGCFTGQGWSPHRQPVVAKCCRHLRGRVLPWAPPPVVGLWVVDGAEVGRPTCSPCSRGGSVALAFVKRAVEADRGDGGRVGGTVLAVPLTD